MVYFAYKRGRVDQAGGHRREFTAASRPPYLTALALWPWLGTWGGGGHFTDARTLVLGANHVPAPHPGHVPKRLKVLPNLGALGRPDSGPASILQPGSSGQEPAEGLDQQDRQIIVDAGILWAVDQKSGERRALRDFNPDTPRPMACPPKAKRWP